MRGWYWPRGWWCPRHPWPPAWARYYYLPYPYSIDPREELKALEDLRKNLEMQISEINKRIEEIKRAIQEKK
ncbi:MAG: DUF5320 domain-containing protein [Nitrososphaerota archaeon]